MGRRDGPLHAHEITPNDAAFLRMMAGAAFGPEARVTLPSGKTITGTVMQQWAEAAASPSRSAPGRFEPLPVARYVKWLRTYLSAGGRISHAYDYPYARAQMLLARASFRTAGECGTAAREILVPPGICHTGGDLGHINLYIEGARPEVKHRGSVPFVPVYGDAEFRSVPGYAEAVAAREAERAAWEREEAARRQRDAGRRSSSDLSAYLQQER